MNPTNLKICDLVILRASKLACYVVLTYDIEKELLEVKH